MIFKKNFESNQTHEQKADTKDKVGSVQNQLQALNIKDNVKIEQDTTVLYAQLDDLSVLLTAFRLDIHRCGHDKDLLHAINATITIIQANIPHIKLLLKMKSDAITTEIQFFIDVVNRVFTGELNKMLKKEYSSTPLGKNAYDFISLLIFVVSRIDCLFFCTLHDGIKKFQMSSIRDIAEVAGESLTLAILCSSHIDSHKIIQYAKKITDDITSVSSMNYENKALLSYTTVFSGHRNNEQFSVRSTVTQPMTVPMDKVFEHINAKIKPLLENMALSTGDQQIAEITTKIDDVHKIMKVVNIPKPLPLFLPMLYAHQEKAVSSTHMHAYLLIRKIVIFILMIYSENNNVCGLANTLYTVSNTLLQPQYKTKPDIFNLICNIIPNKLPTENDTDYEGHLNKLIESLNIKNLETKGP